MRMGQEWRIKMISAWWIIPAFILGGLLGYFFASLMFVAAKAESESKGI